MSARPADRSAIGAGGGDSLLVLIDVGNTNTVLGVYRGDELLESFRLSTDAERTADEYGALLLPLFARAGLAPESAEAVVVSSVVPPLNAVFERLARRFHTAIHVQGRRVLAHRIKYRDVDARGFEGSARTVDMTRSDDPFVGHYKRAICEQAARKLANSIERIWTKNETRTGG